jgi:hypothetical protein
VWGWAVSVTHVVVPFVAVQLVVANPLDACSPLTGSPNYTGKAVLAQRGSCYFYEK